MSWVFSDDHCNEDERMCEAGGLAAWYHTCAHAFCRRKEYLRRPAGEALDFVPATSATGLYAPYTTTQARACIKKLVSLGLWVPIANGYRLDDYMQRYYPKGAPASEPAPAVPTHPVWTEASAQAPNQPTPSQLGGRARASHASRGPAGTFQPRSSQLAPAVTSRLDQPSQLRASDPSPVPEPNLPRKAAAKDLLAGAREAGSDQPEAAAAGLNSAGLSERARAVKDDPSLARTVKPEDWPELREVASAVHEHAQLSPPRLGSYITDADVRALVGLFAAGWQYAELIELAPQLGRWLQMPTPDSRPRTLAMVSPTVLRVAQGEREQEQRVEAQARDLVKATGRPAPTAAAAGGLQ